MSGSFDFVLNIISTGRVQVFYMAHSLDLPYLKQSLFPKPPTSTSYRFGLHSLPPPNTTNGFSLPQMTFFPK